MSMLVSVPEGRSGPWSIERFEIPEKSIETIRAAFSGRPTRPGWYTAVKHDRRGIVMSDTPAEQRDHAWFIRAAKGHVLINGLGIGMCLNAALAKPDVERVTVVEIDQDVISLVAPVYADDRVTIVNESAFDYSPPKGERYGAVWHDIWDAICADNLSEMHKLHRKYGRRADWQGSWCREECEQAKRRW